MKYEDEQGYIVVWPCPAERVESCDKIEGHLQNRARNLKARSGLPSTLLNKHTRDFIVTNPIQAAMKNTAARWYDMNANSGLAPWLFLCGQSGSGKSLLGSICANAVMDKGKALYYIRWSHLVDNVRMGHQELLDQCRDVPVLFLDDLYKGQPTPFEIKLAADLIDYRYTNGLQTLITTERDQNELLDEIDEATTTRIIERTHGCFYVVPRGSGNYRLEQFRKGV